MHIPDGFVDLPTALATGALAAGGVGYASWRLSRTLAPEKVPLLGVAGAFVFAGQMVNFPVAGGTSGHLLGAALVTLLLGPWAAMLVITSVLVVQCLVFQDGGLSALGANVLNMAVIGPLVAAGVSGAGQSLFRGPRGRWVAAGGAAWATVVAAALAAALELIVSGTAPAVVVLPAMVGVHALIGLGEAALTVGALAAVVAARPDLWPVRPRAEVQL
ncbi:MAG TPA: energy-coupling factor ABC transporter permease [Armatimonadota bacterium]|jgi:cobalt/nickel transport system permease protein